MKQPSILALAPLLGLCLAPACLAAPAPQVGTTESGTAKGSAMRPLLDQYFEDHEDLSSFYPLHRAPIRMERLEAMEAQWLQRLEGLDYAGLDVAERIDFHLLRSEIEFETGKRELLRAQIDEAAAYLPFQTAVFDLETARWEIEALDPEGAARALAAIATQAEEALEKLKEQDEAELDAPAGLRLAQWTRQSRSTLGTWYEHYAKFLPEFAWWCKQPYEEARENLDEYRKYLREEIGLNKGEDDDPLVGNPIGREALTLELKHEWLAYSPEELIAIGEKQLAWCEAQLVEASREMGHGDDWKAALEEVKNLHVAPGEQDQLVAGQARAAIAWLKENDLVTIPALCEETWRVKMIDEKTQRTLPFAAYGGQKMLVAFPTSVMDHESKLMSLRGNNIHFTRCVTPHELIPGHHLQGFMAARYGVWRQPFRTPFLGEGWALYWEMVEYDGGWPRGPEDRIGMLFWRMHRAARIIVSLRFHLGDMQSEEMVDFLVERVGHERDNATSEVRRYVGPAYSPLYQCGYMIGGMQLRALSQEVAAAGSHTSRQFHDAILQENSIPIELIRAAVTGQKLERDARASWKPELLP